MKMKDISNIPGVKLSWLIRDLEHLHMLVASDILAEYDLHSAQPRILGTIARMNRTKDNGARGATQKDIADALQTSPAALAMSMKRLQKAGLIEKREDETDLRVNQIHLTEKGKQIHNESLSKIVEIDQHMLEGFSAEETAQLFHYLNRLYDNLKKQQTKRQQRPKIPAPPEQTLP